MKKLSSGDLLRAANAADLAANAPLGVEGRHAEMAAMAELERVQIGLINERMQRLSQSPHAQERLPLRAEGDDFGRVESRIPRDLFYHLMKQKNFGWEGLTSDEGMKDLLKAYPACRVKTVSNRPTFGYTGRGGRRSGGGVVFGRGTLQLAN